MWSFGTVGLRACSRRVDVAHLVGGFVAKPQPSHQSLIRSLSTSTHSPILSAAARFPRQRPVIPESLQFATQLRFASSSSPAKQDPEKSSAASSASASPPSAAPTDNNAPASSSLASRLSGRIKSALQAQLSKSAPHSKDGASPAPTTFPDLSRLFSLVMPQKKNLGLAFILLVVSSCISLTVPFAIGRLIDFFTSGQSVIYGLSFGSIAALMLLVFMLGAGAKAGSNILFELCGIRVIQGIRSQAYRSALRQDVELADKGAGDVVSRLSVDTNIVGESLTSDIGDGLRAGVTVLFAGTAMFLISSKLTLLMMAVVPPAAIGAVFYGRYLRELTHKTQEAIGQMTRLAEERLSPPAFRTLTAFNTQRQESRRFDSKIGAIVELQTKEAYATGFFYAGTGLVGNCAILTLLTYGGHLVSRGEISVGDLTSLLMYTAYLGGGMVSLTSFFASLMKGLGAGARVFELIDRESNIALGKGETLLLTAPSSSAAAASSSAAGPAQVPIRFENVHFSYPSRPNQPILRGVSLDIEPGQSYALVGGSGAGKSSVHSLLLRFYDPNQGRITIAGKDLASFTPESVRKQLAFVPQEPVLFDGSIEDNIRYGTDGATREQVQEAARMAGCESFIASLPRGIDTVIGSRQLSGGQRQRIAIARALVRQPSILLLDEATSALDSASESTVNSAIQHIIRQGNITVWIVAHRLSTIKSANNIQVLENGKIVEQGTFEQLDQPGSRFRALMAAQLDQPPAAQTDDHHDEPATPVATPSMGGRRMYSTGRRTTHPAIPDKGTWSLASVIHPPGADADMLSESQLVKLHKLAALVPPSAPEDLEKLNKQLHTLLRLVRGIHAQRTTPVETVDSRVLAQDASWHVSLGPETPGQVQDEALNRDTELLSHVDKSRKYGGYFVVNRS